MTLAGWSSAPLCVVSQPPAGHLLVDLEEEEKTCMAAVLLAKANHVENTSKGNEFRVV